MRSIVPSVFFLAVLAVGSSAHAQTSIDVPPPKPPLVAAMPNPADWTITVKPRVGAPAATPTPQGTPGRTSSSSIVEVHSTKSGTYRRDMITFSDGRKVTHWVQGQLVFWTTPQGQPSVSDLSTFPAMAADDPEPTAADGFPGMRWLQLAYFDKVVAVEKRPCYHYVHGDNEAWIDAASGLPVAYRSHETLYSYRFGEPPTELLILPPEFQKAAERVQQITRRRRLLEGGSTANR